MTKKNIVLEIFKRRNMDHDKKWIMISGPYRHAAKTQEEMDKNLEEMNKAAVAVFKKGYVPIIGVNMALPMIQSHPEENLYENLMMPISLALSLKCDGVLRIGGESKGADDEMNLIQSLGGVVYFDLKEIPDANSQLTRSCL